MNLFCSFTCSFRAVKYQDMAAKGVIDPAKLPPTQGAVIEHMFRVYFQCTVLKKLSESVLDPSEWGWLQDNGIYTPLKSADNCAPEDILQFIRCKCKTKCTSKACSCRKNGLKCVLTCTNCRGECENNEVIFSHKYIFKCLYINLFQRAVFEADAGIGAVTLENVI